MSPILWAFTLSVFLFAGIYLASNAFGIFAPFLINDPRRAKIFALSIAFAATLLFAEVASSLIGAVPAFAMGAVLFLGSSLRSHMKRRTTAAYSTSDLYHQRLFNLTVLVDIAGLAGGSLGFSIGMRFGTVPVTAIDFPVPAKWTLLLVAVVIFVRNMVSLATHRATIVYLMRNYFVTWRADKLKRLW